MSDFMLMCAEHDSNVLKQGFWSFSQEFEAFKQVLKGFKIHFEYH
jgi:hypothetical protein